MDSQASSHIAMEQATSYVAIDIAKDTLQVQTCESSFQETNDAAGFAAILRRTRRMGNRHFVFEATGGYERALLDHLHRRGHAASLVPAARVRAFAASEGIKAKTDPIDARVILRFAQEKRPAPAPAPTESQRELQALVDRREQLSEHLKREKTRRRKCEDCVRQSIESSITLAKEQIAELDSRIKELVGQDGPMLSAFKVLIAIKGVGPVTAWTIIAHLPEITSFRRSEVVALAGLAPFNHDTGKTQGPRSIFGGRAKVRRCLYMAALAAKSHNGVIKPYYQGLKERGKPSKVALVAAMRKLLIHAHAQLKKHEIKLA